MSTDKLLSAAGMALAEGETPAWLPPVPWGPPKVKRPGSPNHRAEAAAVALAAYKPPHELALEALHQCIARLEQQRAEGHQTIGVTELLTDSHCPHWYRAMGVMHTAARERSAIYLEQCVLQWWAGEVYLCNRLLVPRGPRKGQVIGLGARFHTGQDTVRDVCQALITGRPLPKLPNGRPIGPKWWANAAVEPGTWACVLVRKLVEDGAFKGLRPVAPTLPVPYVVERDEEGHTCRTPDGSLQKGDPTYLRVEYTTGITEWRL